MSAPFQNHLYMICYPNQALVLSQLSPEDFCFRYSYGSASFYSGKLIFAELDLNYRNDFFPIDEALAHFHAHENGSPKATKYISAYRVLEHVDVEAVETLYLANADGSCLPLKPGPYQSQQRGQDLKLYAEIAPISMLTLAKYEMEAFGRHFTEENQFLHVPHLLFAQIELDMDAFLQHFEMDPFIAPPLAGVHPSKLRDAILDLRQRPEKMMKGLTLDMAFRKESYQRISNGLMFMGGGKKRFFPLPSMEEIEREHYRFYKSM